MPTQKKLHLVALGCDKNLVDAEKMLGLLYQDGWQFTDDPADAALILVNTCCFIGDAKEESVKEILRMADYKAAGSCRALVITGCMAERYRDEILSTLPEVDGVIGTNAYQEIATVVHEILERRERPERFIPISENHLKLQARASRIVTTGGHYAYLKIAEGCDKRCTYCIIPYLRGSYRSVPMEDLLKEAAALVEGGARELILVAQETTLYGLDLYGKKMLPELLRQLSGIDGLFWIRILYCYPEEITDELVDAIRTLPKVCRYLDLPIQHASDHILRRMARRTTRAEITERIHRLREEIPDICLRTTMISGFPGETDADHQILLEFIREMEFERLGDFTYSREEGTPAASFSHQVSKRRKEERRDEVMRLQQEIAFKKARSQIGRHLPVLIEGRVVDADDSGNVYLARTYMDAPGVDGALYLRTGKREFMTGDVRDAVVTAARDYDLIGELLD